MKKLIIGIQGGMGSFNEEALLFNWKQKRKYEIKYLYTTKKVLQELEKGNIDLGQFAISNKLGGLVSETIDVIGSFKFRIKEKYSLNIEQCLICYKDSSLEQIKVIMSHPQGFEQCKNNLKNKYSYLKLTTGKGEYVDPAYIVKQISTGKIDKNIAVIGNKTLARIYDFKILERNFQDSKDNYTTFLLVSRF